MPTAAEHRGEATALAATIDTARSVRADLHRDRDDLGVRGGGISVAGPAVDASITGLDELARLVTALVDELHRRASLCDQYTADLQRYGEAHRRWVVAARQYRARLDTDHPTQWPGPEPLPPAAPFPGAVAA